MINIAFLDSSSLPSHIVLPKPNFAHTLVSYPRTEASQVVERAKDAQIIITSKVKFDRSLLKSLPNLKLIALVATGMDNIDCEAARELGIVVKNVSGYSSGSVSEHVMALIYSLRHSLNGWSRDILTQRWSKNESFCYFDWPIKSIHGSTIGIVGRGDIGQAVAKLAEANGMKPLFAEHINATSCREGYLPFDEVFARADIITLHCPLNDETKELINIKTLAMCKPGAILINTGRGGLVNEKDLLDSLQSGQLSGAALDVLQIEPPSKDNILLNAAKELPQLMITPHIAWAADEAVELLARKVIDNLNEFVTVNLTE